LKAVNWERRVVDMNSDFLGGKGDEERLKYSVVE
jgi:hypothetical protein